MLDRDPRGFNVNPTNPPTEEEQFRPFLWRFWIKSPAAGRIAIFDRSWYGRVLVERVDKLVKKKVWQRAFDEINSFEKILGDEDTVMIKFFLHISKKEQKKRFKKLRANRHTAWKVTKEDWKHHRQYGKYEKAVDAMLAKTNPGNSPWHIIPAHDRRHAIIQVFQTVISLLEKKISQLEKKRRFPAVKLPKISGSVLAGVDLSQSLNRNKYEEELKQCQRRLFDLEHEVFIRRIPVVILYQGWDAAGKGGNIKRLVQGLDPRGYEVVPVAAPNDIEKAHHYLWRFWNKIPKAGHITIFDRTWYGRVLVERVEGFCRKDEWQRAYREINEFEKHLADFGTVSVKFWLHLDQDEQLKRFKARKNTPHKQWKITEEDWRNREKWPLYKTAVDEMLFRTSTNYAPWTIIEGNNKPFARIKTIETVIRTVEKKLK